LAHFEPDDCNFCTCYYGRIKCTNLTCQSTAIAGSSTYLNCDCPRVHQPVCTTDGHTLPNSCTAVYVNMSMMPHCGTRFRTFSKHV
jgi:hypothetical protein